MQGNQLTVNQPQALSMKGSWAGISARLAAVQKTNKHACLERKKGKAGMVKRAADASSVVHIRLYIAQIEHFKVVQRNSTIDMSRNSSIAWEICSSLQILKRP